MVIKTKNWSGNDLMESRNQKVLQIYGCNPFIVGHNPVKFSGHKLRGIGDLTSLISPLTSLDPETKGLHDLVGLVPSPRSPS